MDNISYNICQINFPTKTTGVKSLLQKITKKPHKFLSVRKSVKNIALALNNV